VRIWCRVVLVGLLGDLWSRSDTATGIVIATAGRFWFVRREDRGLGGRRRRRAWRGRIICWRSEKKRGWERRKRRTVEKSKGISCGDRHWGWCKRQRRETPETRGYSGSYCTVSRGG